MSRNIFTPELSNKLARKVAAREVYSSGVAREGMEGALDRYFPADWPPVEHNYLTLRYRIDEFVRDIRLSTECYPPLWIEA